MKTCSRCKQPKVLEEFSKDRSARDGLRCYCRKCAVDHQVAYSRRHRERLNALERARREKNPEKIRLTFRRSDLKRKYGLTVEDYDSIQRRQENKCACCGDALGLGKARAVDHCHKTGKVRGLLCSNCNTGIGQFKDSPERLLRAVGYLKKFEYLSVLF